jgi:phosphoglycolate phosphatase
MARIVFDLDGTLIDSVPDIAAAANATLAEIDAAPLSLEQARGFVGAGAGVFVARMAQLRGLSEPARLMPRFLHHYERAVGLTEVYAGVEEALDGLAAAGHRLGLCTNKPARPTKAVLAHLGWQDRFEVVLAGDSLPQRKPDPAPLKAAFDGLGDGPMIYVGDSEIDAEAGQRAGVPFLIYTPGYRSARLEELPHAAAFDDWSEVLAIVAKMT